VLLNLLSNAFKFTPPGGRVACHLQREGDKAVFSIRDTGPGVRPELRGVIFERFHKGEEADGRPFGGTGLGLSIAKDFVELHGGSLRVEDAPGGGAVFRAEFPLQAPPGASLVEPVSTDFFTESLPAEQAAEELRARAAPPAPLQPRDRSLVLVVEDNPEMREFIVGILSPEYRVETASDGAEGLERAEALRPDAIVSDIMMPRMDGDELLREIRKRPAFDRTPVVLLTAMADERTRVRLLREGAQDYLTKPFEAPELLVRVANLVRRKLAEEKLAFHARLLDTIGEAVVATDDRSRVTAWNQAAEALFGWKREEVLGRPVRKVLRTEFPGGSGREAIRRLREEERFEGEVVQRRKDGSPLRMETTALAFQDAEGRRAGFISVLRDVTARKEAEEALRKSEQMLRLLVNGVKDYAIFMLDPQGLIASWNEGAARINGYAAEEVLGRHFSLFFPEPDVRADKPRESLETAAREGRIEEEGWRVRKDGSRFWAHVLITALRDADGALRGFAKITRDATARRRAEEVRRRFNKILERRVERRTQELAEVNGRLQREIEERSRMEEAVRQSEERYRAFVEQSTEGIWRMELAQPIPKGASEDEQIDLAYRHGYLAECNDAMAHMYGYGSAKEIVGARLGDLLDRSAPGNEEILRRFIRAGYRLTEAECLEADRHGNKKWFLNNFVAIHEDGYIRRAWGTQTDVTARKQADEKLKASLAEKEMLLKEIHHRVKNNLQLVYSLLSLETRRMKDPQALRGLVDCRDRVRAMALAHEKLYRSHDLSRIDFLVYLRDLAGSLGKTYGAAGRGIELVVEADPLHLDIDTAIPCGLIACELISNAFKHAFPQDRPGGRIRVSFRREGPGRLALVVGDDGVGLPRGLDVERTDSLGLHLIQNLVKQLEGTVELASRPGAEFRITFRFSEGVTREEVVS
jgi:PAS domain S-box-containing protein